jgi:NADH-quinone oxidoreductase subunit N
MFHRMMVLDNFSLFFKIFALAATILCIWMSLGSNEIKQVHQGEYYTLLLTCTLGMSFMASSSNLLMAYLSLELVSLTSYVLTGFLPHNRRSSEAALKYLIYGGVASGTMIYGMSWIFGMTGSLDYGAIQTSLAQIAVNKTALFIALVFILAGFGYKIVFVPFHMWSPDVYQGAPTPFTAFLSVASNAAGLAILIRFFFPGHVTDGAGRRLDGRFRSRMAAGFAIPQHDYDDNRQSLRVESAQSQTNARLLGDRSRGLYDDGLGGVEQRRAVGDSLLHRGLFDHEPRRISGHRFDRQCNRRRGHRRLPRPGLARRGNSGELPGDFSAFPNRLAAVRGIHRQVFSICGGAQSRRSIRHSGSGGSHEQRSFTLLLREDYQDDVPRHAQPGGKSRNDGVE